MAYNPNNPNGQATMANSTPVVLASDQSAVPISDNGGSVTVDGSVTVSGTVTANAGTGTMNVSVQNASIPVTGTFYQATQPVSGTVTANAGTGTFATSDANAVSQSTATASQKGYLSLAGVTATLPTYTSGNTNTLTMTTTGLLRVDGSNATQPVSGTVTADTELPAAAALADGASNPTTPTIGGALLGFNGTTWDRLRTDGTDNDADPVASTGVLSVEAHVQGFNGTNFDRLRTIDAMSGTSANNTVVGIQAVGTGPGYAHRYNPTALGTATNSASTIEVEGGNTMTWAIATSTTGTFIFEASSDAVNWLSVEVFDASLDQWVSGQNLTPTSGKTYHVACGGYRQVRIRTTATLGATVTHYVNVSNSQQLLAGIDTGAAPHNFGYTLVHKDAEYTTAQTGTVVWTPTTGKKFAITDITISVGGTTSGVVTIFDATTATTTYTAGTTPAIFRGAFAPSTTSSPGAVKSFNVPYVSTTANNVVHITTSAAMTVYIQINGYEI